jgi:TolA-binding protein
VPAYVRYRLADLALAGYDIAFAGRLMHGLETPPNGEDQEVWALRRARVLVYAGRYADARQLLTGLLNGKKKINDEFAERLLQVIFDFQAAQRQGDAIALLEQLWRQVDNPRTQREILYWIAESRAAQGEYQQAAELYLRSATYQHPTGGDMWGQTARFHAAEALGKAGLTQDARLVFQALLKHTADAKQRAVIERSIQQLWLIEKQATTP